MYANSTCSVVHSGKVSSPFNIETGVRQGCLLSPLLFLLAIDWTMKQTVSGHNNGIQWSLTTQLNDLDFADDVALLSHNARQMKGKTERLCKFGESLGLHVNSEKSKLMRLKTSNKENIEVNGCALENVEEFTYLGSIISTDGGTDKDILARIGKARTAFAMLKNIWRSKQISLKTKLRLFNSNVKSVLLYGSETWRETKQNVNRLQSFINRCLRHILNIRWPETISNVQLWKKTDQCPINHEIKKRKWGWVGHTLRRPPSSIARQTLRWNPQGKRNRGRPRHSWRRTIESEIQQQSLSWNDIQRTAQNRVRWRQMVEALCSPEERRN